MAAKKNVRKPSLLKMTTLDQVKDKFLGKIGTKKRDEYERELTLELFGEMIKRLREDQNLTQSQLAKKLGIDKSGVSKVENSVKSQRVNTLLKFLDALNAKMYIRIEARSKSGRRRSKDQHFKLA